MEPAAKEKWESKATELFKCPIKNCEYSFRVPRALLVGAHRRKFVEDRVYVHLYKFHRKPEIIKGILILAGLTEDLEEAS